MIGSFATALEKRALAAGGRQFAVPRLRRAKSKKPEPDRPWDYRTLGEKGRKGEITRFDDDAGDWNALEGTTINPQT